MDGTILYSNQAGRVTFEYSREDVTGGVNIRDFFSAEDRPGAMEVFNQAARQGLSPGGAEYRLVTRTGRELTCFAQIRPMYFNDEITGVRASLMDITDIKMTRLHLRASEEKYRTIMESIEEGILRTRPGR